MVFFTVTVKNVPVRLGLYIKDTVKFSQIIALKLVCLMQSIYWLKLKEGR